MENELPKEPEGVEELREVIQRHGLMFRHVFWAMGPKPILTESGDNYEEIEVADFALLDEIARFAGQYIAETAFLREDSNPILELDRFLKTVKTAYDDEMRTN